MLFEFVATLCASTFFGAAAYISLVQHPAALSAGGVVPGRFFAPMYRRAAPMQASLAVLGSLMAFIAWLAGSGWAWLLGGFLLVSVVPFTLLCMKSVTGQLLRTDRDPEAPETLELLRRWGMLHGIRSVASGLAVLLFLTELATG